MLLPFGTIIISFVFSIILIPAVRKLSNHTGLVSHPRHDRWAKQPTAILGGVGIYLAFFLTTILLNPEIPTTLPLLLSSTGLFLLGLIDDIREISPPSKIIGQILAAGYLIYAGYRIEFFSVELLNVMLTFAWIIIITNAINLLDNMDGLAGGISLIVCGFLAFFFYQIPDQYPFFLYALALCGAIGGFLVYNFPPAKIFMGDSGSMFIGFTLASLAVIKKTSASNVLAVLGIPLLLFLLPLLDTTLVTITRVLRGQSPVQGGKDHTSHRLVAFGLNERQALLVLFSIALISGIASTIIEQAAYDFSLVFVPVLIVGLSIFAAYLGKLQIGGNANHSDNRSAISKVAVRLAYRQNIFEIFLDFFIISIAYYLALWTQYDLAFSPSGLNLFIATLPVTLGMTYLSFFLFGVYRGVWEFFGVSDLLIYVKAVIGATIFTASALWLLSLLPNFRIITFLLFGMFLLIAVIATRSSFRVLDQVFTRRRFHGVNTVLLYGAGESGEFVARWILLHPDTGFKPIGFIDDDFRKWGKEIHGIKVLGGSIELEKHLTTYQPQGIIITLSGESDQISITELSNICQKQGVWLKQVRFEFEQINIGE